MFQFDFQMLSHSRNDRDGERSECEPEQTVPYDGDISSLLLDSPLWSEWKDD